MLIVVFSGYRNCEAVFCILHIVIFNINNQKIKRVENKVKVRALQKSKALDKYEVL